MFDTDAKTTRASGERNEPAGENQCERFHLRSHFDSSANVPMKLILHVPLLLSSNGRLVLFLVVKLSRGRLSERS